MHFQHRAEGGEIQRDRLKAVRGRITDDLGDQPLVDPVRRDPVTRHHIEAERWRGARVGGDQIPLERDRIAVGGEGDREQRVGVLTLGHLVQVHRETVLAALRDHVGVGARMPRGALSPARLGGSGAAARTVPGSAPAPALPRPRSPRARCGARPA